MPPSLAASGTVASRVSLMSDPVSVLKATSRPPIVLFRMSLPRMSLLRMSWVRMVLFFSSRLSMKPVATP